MQYRQSLEAAASKPRFYAASFAKDPFSVAETLLRWRDELVLAGWDGSADPVGSSQFATWLKWKDWLVQSYCPAWAIVFRQC